MSNKIINAMSFFLINGRVELGRTGNFCQGLPSELKKSSHGRPSPVDHV